MKTKTPDMLTQTARFCVTLFFVFVFAKWAGPTFAVASWWVITAPLWGFLLGLWILLFTGYLIARLDLIKQGKLADEQAREEMR